ncbi:hypothetical protein PFICI_08346 [Pestalotiopsis fici W106-1]|uniref:Nephrocystin 3-like N-terminal domain-containing protein n=1 Tax=Pestalotiopsis fici (strain W106-1 / CGMCC3.15140) TaxID=1229662 RepID=W3X612_PESFW|nr:uncharacterized protein PFICI_08346 [Pestalotiopsis fici W106-1]ETS80817.1 hypothetical protein PFICI_08346 [Pestalotiopsis fici W106-1]
MPEPGDYTIGWICALRTELVAATAFLDEKHDDPDHLPANDDNAYVLGRIGKHNVVIAALPHGQYGLVSAANVAKDLLRSFTNIRIGLMVGIGGGAPSDKHDVRLGDIVVGTPGNGRGGVLQYDYGKTVQDKDFQMTGHLNQPPQCILTALTVLGAQYEVDGHDIQAQIDRVLEGKPRLRANYQKPNAILDRLYSPSFTHAGNDTENCATTCDDNSKLVTRLERLEGHDSPVIHYGLIASANQLMKDAHIRDDLSTKEDILCFEMEAAGLMNNFPCLVIRGVCDYSDTHKNKVWQGYAAMAAAAFAKDLLCKVAPNKVAAEKKLNEYLSDVDAKLSVISDSLSQSQTKMEALHTDKHVERIVRWLAAPEISNNLNAALEIRHQGSGQKLIEGEAYVKWRKDAGSFLWLSGIPGCGKTILASTLIQDLQSNPQSSQNLLYYYFDFTDTLKQMFKNAIRSLLTQLYLKSESAKITLHSLYASCKNGWEQPSVSLLCSTFATMVEQAGEIWIVLDALDECPRRYDLLDWLRDLRANQKNAHVLVTSRPEQDIKSAIDRICTNQEIVTVQNELLKDDIRSYVQARVKEHESLSRWRNRPDIQEEIEVVLVDKANGMFRCVACQLDALEKCCDPKTLRSTLVSLPKTLDETYERILARIPPEHMCHAIRLLQFLTYSERPLRVNEAVDAIAIDLGPEVPRGSRFHSQNRMPIPAEITIYCSSLVVLVRRELKRSGYRPKYILEEIQLAHFSVKDYLISDRLANGAAQHLKETSARSLMAEACLAYLLELDPKVAAIRQKTAFPFSEYSANYWASYAMVGEQNSTLVRKLAMELLQSPESIDTCRQLQTRFWEPPVERNATALYYASLLGLPLCVDMLVEQGADINARGGLYGQALQAASANGHRQVVQLLIGNGANVQACGGHHGNALNAASSGGYAEISKLLIAKGADVNTEEDGHETALQTASAKGHVEIVQLLIENGANIHAQGGKHGNALRAAIAGRHSQAVQVLRGNKPYAHAQSTADGKKSYLDLADVDRNGSELLRSAAADGDTGLVDMLLDLGVDCNTYAHGWTLFHWAAGAGHVGVVKLLLDRGADASISDNFGSTPLNVAARKGYVEVVKLLRSRS